jgi:hypothetical protein
MLKLNGLGRNNTKELVFTVQMVSFTFTWIVARRKD